MRRAAARHPTKPATVVLAHAFVAITTAIPGAAGKSSAVAPLTLASARVSLEGTSNIHAYTASTKTGLAVTGATDLLMTDSGVTPPKAMLGMLKTNPKVRIHLDLVIAPS